MKTRKPISTVSFNTPLYLIHRLEELRNGGIITKWYAMPHQPEDDEGGKKWHIHLYIEPAKQISTDDLSNELKEFDSAKPDKPRGVLPFKYSKFADWYFYALHDPAYLASKGEARRFSYTQREFLVFDRDSFNFDVKTISRAEYSAMQRLFAICENNGSFEDAVAHGFVPVNQVFQYEKMFSLLRSHQTERGGRLGHEEYLDPSTGEYVVQMPHADTEYFETISHNLAEFIFGAGSYEEDDV